MGLIASPAMMVGGSTGRPRHYTDRVTKSSAPEPLADAPALAESEHRFRELVEQITEYAIFLLDSDGHVDSWNRGAQRIKGYRPHEVIGRHFSVFYRPEDLWKCEHELEAAARDGRIEDEGWRVRKDGSLFWANVVITCLRAADGSISGFAKVTRDLTERRSAEERLRVSEERFRLLVEGVEDYAVFMLDPSGHVATWNSGAQLMKGYTGEEIIGRHFSLFYEESERRAGKSEQELAIAVSHGRFEEEAYRVRKDGTRFWANVVLTAVRNSANELIGFAKVTRDLTERREAEVAMTRLAERARERIHALAALSERLTGALTLDEVARVVVEDGRVFAQADICTLHSRTNDTLELLAERGVSPEVVEVLRRIGPSSGNPFYDIGTGTAREVWVESAEAYAREAPVLAQLPSSGRRARSFACLPLMAEGQTLGTLGIGFYDERRFSDNEREFVGIVARQCAQALARARNLEALSRTLAAANELRASLQTTLRSIGDGVIATDASGQVTLMNNVAESLTGWAEAEARGKQLDEVFRIVNEHSRETVPSPVQKVLETGAVVGLANHTVLLARDGREVPIDDSGAPIRAEGGAVNGVVLVFRDVGERKHEESRRDLLAEVTAALSQSLDYEATVGGIPRLVVPRMADWCAVDLVVDGAAQPRRLAISHADPQKVAFVQQLAERYPQSPEASSGVAQVLRSGFPELYPDIPDSLLQATAQDAEHLGLLRALGLRSVLVVPLAVPGRVLGALSFGYAESGRSYSAADLPFAQDLARRCAIAIDNARLYQAEQRARRDADLANRAKDEFLAVVSHELRTPLNAILGWSKLLSRTDFDERRRVSALETVERNAVAMAQLIEDLLDMSRVVSGKLRLNVQRAVLAQIVEAAVESVRPSASSKGISLHLDFDPAAPDLVGDPTRLQQIVWNLLSNAVKFTQKGGVISVALRRTEAQLEVTVSDSGRGIDSEFLPHVFDAFRQGPSAAATSRGGLGLGLAITKQLVELHGGRIEARSEGPGTGATFTVAFPILPSSAADSAPPSLAPESVPPPSDLAQLHGLRILVVDDDDDARVLLTSILDGYGCRVRSASNVAEALVIFGQQPPDVLISDVAMPGADGYELIRRVRALSRDKGGDVPAAAITAYARPEDRSRLLNAGFSIHLPKPIDPAEVVAVVSTLTRFIHRRATPVTPL
jgi:PAS domain S-box-containing protein